MCKVLSLSRATQSHFCSIEPYFRPKVCIGGSYNLEYIFKHLLSTEMAGPNLCPTDQSHDRSDVGSEDPNSRDIRVRDHEFRDSSVWNHGGNNEWLSRVTPPLDLENSEGVDLSVTENSVVAGVVDSILSPSSSSSSSPSLHPSYPSYPPYQPSYPPSYQPYQPSYIHSSLQNNPDPTNIKYNVDNEGEGDTEIVTSSSKETISADSDSLSETTPYTLESDSLKSLSPKSYPSEPYSPKSYPPKSYSSESNPSKLNPSKSRELNSGRRSKTPPPLSNEQVKTPIPPGSQHNKRHRSLSLRETGSSDRLNFEFGRVPRRIHDVDETSMESDQVKNIDWTKQNQRRAGVIVYFIRDGVIVFGMGSDSDYEEITDFGGGFEPSIDTDPLDTALREFKEETLGVYGNIDRNAVSECVVVLNQIMLIMFVPLEFDPTKTTVMFGERLLQEHEPEINELVWISKRNFLNMITDQYVADPDKKSADTNTFSVDNINSRRMYERVSTFLGDALNCLGDFTQKL